MSPGIHEGPWGTAYHRRRTKGERGAIFKRLPDRLDEAQLDDLRRELAIEPDTALPSTYEIYRMARGLRKDGTPRAATM